MKRIAFLNFGGIGDEILFSPVIQAVAEAYPEAELSLILETRSRAIADFFPQSLRLIPVQVQGTPRWKLFFTLLKHLITGRYDVVIASGSSPFIALLLKLSGIPLRIGFDTGPAAYKHLSGVAPLRRKAYAGTMYFALAETFFETLGHPLPEGQQGTPHLSVSDDCKKAALATLTELGSQPKRRRVMIHPGVSRVSIEKNILKAWPVDYWQALITKLLLHFPDVEIVLLGGPDDQETIQSLSESIKTLPARLQSRILNAYGHTRSMKDLAGLLSWASVFVSVDSAPMHLAIALGTQTTAIFGPTDPDKLVPPAPNVHAVYRGDLSCRPCLWDTRQTSCDQPDCLTVPVEAVFDQIEHYLSE